MCDQISQHSYWPETRNRKIFLFKSVYVHTLLIFVSACPFVTTKRQNGQTDLAQFSCGTSHEPREGLCMLKITLKPKILNTAKNFIK